MPAYNFKQRFAPDVKSGKKLQTIRPRRNRPTVPGDKLVLYTGMRTQKCELLRITTCTEVLPVVIEGRTVSVGGNLLTIGEIVELAQSDGFERAADFFEFFEHTYPSGTANMELIKWLPVGCDV